MQKRENKDWKKRTRMTCCQGRTKREEGRREKGGRGERETMRMVNDTRALPMNT